MRGPEGERELGPFDTFAVVGTRPHDPLSASLRQAGVEVHRVGDAEALGQIQGAVRSAWELARQL